jgi:serine/threonine protein kinase
MADTNSNAGQTDAGLPPKLGHYDLGEMIGQGGMAVVYKGLQPSLNRAVAIKVLPPQFATTPELLTRFEREAAIVANLNHSNIVQVIDRGREGKTLFIVMEYVEGQNLDKLIRAGKLALPQVIDIASQICDGLAYAHRSGVVHRDLKPANILVDQRTGRVKIADFGIAALETTDAGLLTLTVDHSVIGTMNYMSPEQRLDSHDVTSATDIFAFGVILYEMLTGKLPVGHFKLPSMIRPDMPLGLDSIVTRCLAESPGDRYADAAQIRDELQSLTTRHTAPRSFSALGRLNKREKWVALGGSAAAVLILLVGSALLVRQFRPQQRPPVVAAREPPTRSTAAEARAQADLTRAQGLVSQAKWREAITAYQEMIRQYPQHALAAEAQFGIAVAYEQLKEWERGILEYGRLVQNHPASARVPEGIVRRCRIEFERGRQRRIFSGPVWDANLQTRLIAELQDVVDKSPKGPQAASALVLIATIAECPALEEVKVAAAALTRLHALGPAVNADALFHAAELYDADAGDKALAAETYAQFLKEFPYDARAVQAQGRLRSLRPKEAR